MIYTTYAVEHCEYSIVFAFIKKYAKVLKISYANAMNELDRAEDEDGVQGEQANEDVTVEWDFMHSSWKQLTQRQFMSIVVLSGMAPEEVETVYAANILDTFEDFVYDESVILSCSGTGYVGKLQVSLEEAINDADDKDKEHISLEHRMFICSSILQRANRSEAVISV